MSADEHIAVLVVCSAHDSIGGLERSIAALRDPLKSRNVSVEILVVDSARSTSRNTAAYFEPVFRVHESAGVKSVTRLIKAADVVHIHAPSAVIWPAWLLVLSKILATPVALTVHLPGEPSGRRRLFGRIKRSLALRTRGALVRALAADPYAPSPQAAAIAEDRYGGNGNKFGTLFMGVPDVGQSVPSDPRNPDPLRIGFVGRLSKSPDHKKPGVLLDAVAELTRRGVASRTWIVGDGEYRQELEARVAALSLADSVTFTGFVSDPAEYLRQCDVLVITSEREGLPLVAMEAAAIGRGLVLREGLSGFGEGWDGAVWTVPAKATYREFADALQALAADRGRIIELGAGARSVYESRFSADQAGERHASVYRRLAAISAG